MSGISLEAAQARLDAYIDAEAKTLANQRYKIGDRELQRASLADIRAGINFWDQKVSQLTRGSSVRVRLGTPVA